MKTAFLVKFDGYQFTHIWKIEEVIPGERIVYNWLYAEYEGEASLFLSDSRESAENGWEFLINQNLKEYLDNKV